MVVAIALAMPMTLPTAGSRKRPLRYYVEFTLS